MNGVLQTYKHQIYSVSHASLVSTAEYQIKKKKKTFLEHFQYNVTERILVNVWDTSRVEKQWIKYRIFAQNYTNSFRFNTIPYCSLLYIIQ